MVISRQNRIGIGPALLHAAIGRPAAEPGLELLEVDRIFESIESAQGSGSTERRRELLNTLFSRAMDAEQRFLIGLLGGGLRQGALEGIMLEALSRASRVPLERVRRATMIAGSIPPVARALLERGEAGLSAYDVQLFRPVQPMLAQTAEDAEQAMAELGEAALEWKVDGARIQVHRSGGDVAVYTRSLKDVTAAVPEVVEASLALPRRISSWMAKSSVFSRTHVRIRSKSRCVVSGANWM